jgi:hypothetical protein
MLIALVIAASPAVAAVCDAACATAVAEPAPAAPHSGHTAAPDGHAHHHAAAAAATDGPRLTDPSGCSDHLPLAAAEARPTDAFHAPALLPRLATWAASLPGVSVSAAAGPPLSSPAARSSVPLRI